jgi:hypothetical protein
MLRFMYLIAGMIASRKANLKMVFDGFLRLVPKFRVELHVSPAALPILTSKFRPNVVRTPNINIKIPIERSKALLNSAPNLKQSTSCHRTLCIFQRITISQTYLCQMDDRTMHGNL